MRRNMSGLPLLLIALAAGACATGSGTGEIEWVGSVEEALALSAGDGKPVLLYHTYIG